VEEIRRDETETAFPPEGTLLFHYTSFESFLGMAESGTLWASHIRYLNDTSEQRLMWKLVKARIEERLPGASGALHNRLLDLKEVAANPQNEDVYVISFSEDGGDRLSQWRGYGANAGISIGFNLAELRCQCNRFTTKAFKPPLNTGAAQLLKVRYVDAMGNDKTNRIIDAFLDRPLPDSPTSKYSPEQAFSRGISYFSASLKHTAFSDEREWRIIIFDFVGGPTPRYRARKSLLIPFIELDIRNAAPSKIIVGPSPQPENSVDAIKHMLAAKGSMDTEVIATQMPYRDW
jgi:hypothetical protein